MLPGFKAFRVYRGDTFVFQMTLSSGGEAFILDSELVTFTGQVKERGKATMVSQFTIEILDGPNGVIRCILPASESANLVGGKSYEYDIQMDNDGIVSTILKGPIISTSDVTN